MKVGFVHVPKCAGTSLANGLYDAFNMKRRHIASIKDPGKSDNPFCLELGSEAFELAKEAPFLSGHIFFSDMKALDRDFVFTVLREPKIRFFSIFTYYVSRANNEDIIRRNPEYEKFKNKSFYEFANESQVNAISAIILKDFEPARKIFRVTFDEREILNQEKSYLEIIDECLRRFDMILSGDLGGIVKHLAPLTIKREVDVKRSNESRTDIVMNIGCSESDFAKILLEKTWLDEIVFRRAAALFPAYFAADIVDIDGAIGLFKDRYDLRFA